MGPGGHTHTAGEPSRTCMHASRLSTSRGLSALLLSPKTFKGTPPRPRDPPKRGVCGASIPLKGLPGTHPDTGVRRGQPGRTPAPRGSREKVGRPQPPPKSRLLINQPQRFSARAACSRDSPPWKEKSPSYTHLCHRGPGQCARQPGRARPRGPRAQAQRQSPGPPGDSSLQQAPRVPPSESKRPRLPGPRGRAALACTVPRDGAMPRHARAADARGWGGRERGQL